LKKKSIGEKEMRSLKKIIILAASTLSIMPMAFGQDLHFSQFFNSPLTTNPANTGFIPDGNYRLGLNYRNQWSAIMTMPYKTMSVYGDAQILRNTDETGWMGIGGVILRDVAGSGNLASTKIYGSVAYHQMINAGSLLSLGFNVGWANKQINASNLKFPDQFDGKFFDNKLPTGVSLQSNNISYLDMQVGMNYAYFPTDKIYMNAGFSVHHVNKPRESFFSSSFDSVDNRVPRRYIGFLNGSFMVNDQWILNPNVYYTNEANSSELVLGMNAHYNLSGNGDYQLIGGLYYRHKDAFIPLIGLAYKDYTFSFTYDATISTLKNYNNTRGAFEFSLSRQGLFDTFKGNKRQTICPSFRNL
jgi:type IX secretion system PorP/SprF family membrane protein